MSSVAEATATILLVDDEPTNRSIYGKILRDAGYQVTSVASIAETMNSVREEKPDLLLLDVILNNESGLDALGQIRSDPELQDLYVVMITSKLTTAEEQATGLDSGADGYLVRPIEKRELLARVRVFLRHKRTVDSLRKSERRFRKIIDRSPDGILIIDDEGRIRFANPAAEAMFRLDVDELLNQTFGYPMVAGEHTEIEIVSRERRAAVAEMRTIDIEWDEVDSLLTTVRDITARKELEVSLRASEERYRSLFEQAGDGILIYDQEGRIVDVNSALCELLCYSKEELKESTLCRILPPACDAAFLSAEEKEIPGFETQLIAKDGTPRQCEVSIKEVYVREDRRIMQTIIRDISDRLAARANLEKELQEKRTLLRELYHRTKNNMQVISSMLSIKGRKMRGTEAESELEDINSRILAMSLVHRRLYESQNLSRINIREYLVELAGLLRRSYSRRDKEITIDAVAEDHMVSIDVAVPLGQVVTDLLSNSLKHAFGEKSHGKITIELQEGTPGRLLLTYYDDGVGLPPGFGFESHGNLGLETVRLMVEDQLNGTIEILPTRGAGFRIELPKSDFEELHY
ncbi:MAG: PAS domain S-box protein [Spirochaetaceae bacterium]